MHVPMNGESKRYESYPLWALFLFGWIPSVVAPCVFFALPPIVTAAMRRRAATPTPRAAHAAHPAMAAQDV